MNLSHVVYGVCTRDCVVEGYGGPQGPRKVLDNGDFGLATWEHQSPSPLLGVLLSFTFYKLGGIAHAKPTSLGCCKPLSNHENSPFFSCCKHSSSQHSHS
ncbi:unnamed protein product [Prunus brigantina]